MYISGEFGRQWLGTSDAFYGTTVGTAFGGPFPLGIPEPSYNTWNVGVGFTYKVFTLDLRYYDTNLSKGNCNAFTSDYSTTNFSPSFVTAINPGGFGSNWCSPTGVVKFSAYLTAMTNLKEAVLSRLAGAGGRRRSPCVRCWSYTCLGGAAGTPSAARQLTPAAPEALLLC